MLRVTHVIFDYTNNSELDKYVGYEYEVLREFSLFFEVKDYNNNEFMLPKEGCMIFAKIVKPTGTVADKYMENDDELAIYFEGTKCIAHIGDPINGYEHIELQRENLELSR